MLYKTYIAINNINAMVVIKFKNLVSDLLLNDLKQEVGGVNLEKNILECKKYQTTIKAKKNDLTKKKKDNPSVNVSSINDEITKLETDLNGLYADRLFILLGTKSFNTKIINERYKLYQNVIEEYKTEFNNTGKKRYEDYLKMGTKKSFADKPQVSMSKEDYFNKFIGNQDKANLEKRLAYRLMKQYEAFKSDPKSTELYKKILEDETALKTIKNKHEVKLFNFKQLHLFIEYFGSIVTRFIDDVKKVLSGSEVDLKTLPFNSFLKLKSLKSSSTNLYKYIILYSNHYDVIVDKSKEEKNVKANIIDVMDSKDIKNFAEHSNIVKFVMEKNNIAAFISKEFKDIKVLDSKTKNFISYLIVLHFYNTILPLLNMCKPKFIMYKKKQTIKDENGAVKSVNEIEERKKVNLAINRIHVDVISSIWSQN